MIRQLRFAAVALLLASCSTVIDGQIQDVTIETAGADNTLCYMQNREFSFRFYPPQTLKVTKSSDPYTIRCLAPGNREKTLVVEPKVSDNVFWNATNVGTGVPVDHLSAAMYELPDKIVINFEGMPAGGYSQPGYNQFFDKNPHLKGMEEFRAGQAALLRDIDAPTTTLQKREGMAEGADLISSPEGGSGIGSGKGSSNGGQGASLMSIEPLPPVVTTLAPPPVPSGSRAMSAEDLTRSMNPRIFGGGSSTPAATSAPVPMDVR